MLKLGRKKGSGLLPSGVPYTYQNFDRIWQSQFFEDMQTGSKEAYYEYLAKAIISVGNNKNIDAEFIMNMLEGDMKQALFEVRNFTFNSDVFKCKVTFPDETRKITENKSINLDGIVSQPYSWVDIDEEKNWVKMYDDYKVMLDEQRERTWQMNLEPHDAEANGVDSVNILWKIPLASTFENFDSSDRGLDVLIKARMPRYREEVGKNGEGQIEYDDSPMDFNQEGASANYAESFSEHFFEVEANVDTTVELQSKQYPAKTVPIDLMMVKEFFARSLAAK